MNLKIKRSALDRTKAHINVQQDTAETLRPVFKVLYVSIINIILRGTLKSKRTHAGFQARVSKPSKSSMVVL